MGGPSRQAIPRISFFGRVIAKFNADGKPPVLPMMPPVERSENLQHNLIHTGDSRKAQLRRETGQYRLAEVLPLFPPGSRRQFIASMSTSIEHTTLISYTMTQPGIFTYIALLLSF
jgi:hypothetical protein